MTAQIGDIYRYKEEEYKLIYRTSRTFQPQKYGFSPKAWKTSCWDGYWCRYEITDDRLYLQHLQIMDANGFYPEINGVACEPEQDARTNMQSDLKYDPAAISYHYPGRRTRNYHDIGLFLPYTGQVLAGAGHVGGYYIHLGYQRPQSYEKLTEFVFQDGILTDAIDHSQVAELLREEITRRRKEEGKWNFFLEFDLYELMPEADREPLRWFWDRG